MSTQETPWGQLHRLIKAGTAPDKAAEAVMSDVPKRWKDIFRPFVLRRARGIEGEIGNKRMRTAITGRRGTRHQQAAVIRMDKTVYKLPNGQRIILSDWGPDEFEAKIAWLRKQVGSLVDHLHILEAARDLCIEKGVARIGEIPGWVDLVRQRVEQAEDDEGDASGEAEAA